MNELFLKVVNMSISASWLVLAVLALRLVLKRSPKWVNVLLWGIVALRLVIPFSFESALSLIPSAETIPANIEMVETPAIDSGISAINSVVNPVIGQANTPAPGASINPLQGKIAILAAIWAIGVVVLLAYTAISYWRLRRKVSEATLLRDNIYQCESVSSPFVLGIVKPRIYLSYKIEGQDLDHVVAHEQAHISRKDHWWKPLGFLLLTVHWFNPLMWLAYVLLCRDIELACDEKVIKELGNEQRADYSQALLSCSVNRRMIAACPLAFGEVGVKERVKSVMNYRKPAFWVVAASVVACVVVAVCFLTNPVGPRTFPMSGHNVADLDPQKIVSEISRMEKLEDRVLLTNGETFDVQLTADFEWANAAAMRFFYREPQQTYSAQLRLFIEDDEYFVTERNEWPEQNTVYLFEHYLQALKYLPQEQIRQMAPNAEQYIIHMVEGGAPGNYDRVITYTPDGARSIDGWYIHLQVQPMREAESGGYSGTGDEVIHVFYGHDDRAEPAPEASSIYKSWQDAYISAISSIEEQIAHLSLYAQAVAKGALYDLNGDGTDELAIVYPNGEDTLSCALWTFSDGHLIQLADEHIASLAGAGAGGINAVQFEGEKYFCAWASNSTPWDEERGIWYYDCFLWPYPKDLEQMPYSFPQHTFEFRYFTGNGGSHIFSDTFSCVQNTEPLSFDQMIFLKETFLDHPLERLCDPYEPVGMTFDELSTQLS